MTLSPKQIQELLDMIDANVDGFIARHISPTYLSREQKLRLAKYGIKVEGVLTVETAFKLGMLSDMLGRKSMQMNLHEMMRELKAKNYLPLSFREKKALERVQYNSYSEIKGLGQRWSQDLSRIITEGDRKLQADTLKHIKTTAEDAVKNRKSFRWMASELGHKTQDWARDFERMSDFILHDAHDHGRAHDLISREGENAKMYKHVFDHACKHCVRLYLTNGAHSKPRIFEVKELLANGTNVGRKVKDWKPVIGATHPWCRCEMQGVPVGGVWDDKTQDWTFKVSKEDQKFIDLWDANITMG